MSKGISGSPIKVLVVDDSAYNRKMIREMLLKMDEIGQTEAVSDGEEAIKKVMIDPPDVITLDLNMPRMDGFTFLRWLMRNHPLPVVVVSADGGEKNVFKALDLGALDFVVKPVRHASEKIVEIEEELIQKIRAVAHKDMRPHLKRIKIKKKPQPHAGGLERKKRAYTEMGGILVIGASTGGPSSLQGVLSELPADYPFPVVVVQHMPPVFTKQFAKRLERNTLLRAVEASDGDRLEAGQIMVVPGGYHLVFDRNLPWTVKLLGKKKKDRYVPSVDVTMSSVADVFGAGALGVILTGMGSDGSEGMLKIKESGGMTIAEAEETAVVFGMPRAAINIGAVKTATPLESIPRKIIDMTRKINRVEK